MADTEFDILLSEIAHVVGLTYWKNNIHPVGHSLSIINSKNEFLRFGTLTDFLLKHSIKPQQPLKVELARLKKSQKYHKLKKTEEYRAAELMRHRLLRSSYTPHLWKRFSQILTNPTRQLMQTMKNAHISWIEVDDLFYTTRVHDPLGFDKIPTSHAVICIPLRYGTNTRYAITAIEVAIEKMTRSKQSIGCSGEITFVIIGNDSLKNMDVFRSRIIHDVQSRIPIPQGIFISSSIVFKTTLNELQLFNKIEALVRYEHWVENHYDSPKLTWIMPGLRQDGLIAGSLWFIRILTIINRSGIFRNNSISKLVTRTLEEIIGYAPILNSITSPSRTI